MKADKILADSDVFVIPDVMCNAGGATVSHFEIDDAGLRQVRERARTLKLTMQTAALNLGVEKVVREK